MLSLSYDIVYDVISYLSRKNINSLLKHNIIQEIFHNGKKEKMIGAIAGDIIGSPYAAALFMSRTGSGKEEIKKYIEDEYGYDLSRRTDDISIIYLFDIL